MLRIPHCDQSGLPIRLSFRGSGIGLTPVFYIGRYNFRNFLQGDTVIPAQTFTAQYDPLEDRIRLVLNYADPSRRIDFMITRAMLLKLFPVLEQILPEGVEPLRPERETEPPSGGVTRTDGPTLELTRSSSLLLSKLDFKVIGGGNRIVLRFYGNSAEAPAAEANLNREGLATTTALLLGTVPFMEWGIAPNILSH